MTLIQSHNLQPHLYADDTHGFCRPGATSSLESRMSDCFTAVADWMSSNRLQLNATKTEILVHIFPSTTSAANNSAHRR